MTLRRDRRGCERVPFEQMSANAITRQFPQTRAVFDRYGVRGREDGSDRVEEIAWRLGVTIAEVVQRLRAAVHVW